MYSRLTFWLQLFSVFTTSIALPLAQSDFNLFPGDRPGSSFTSSSTSSEANGDFDSTDVLYPNNNERPATNLLAAEKNAACQSNSGGIQPIGKRQSETACAAEFGRTQRQLTLPSQLTTPKPMNIPYSVPLAPPLAQDIPDEDKCPVELMGISQIPVCSSEHIRQDEMRMPGFDKHLF